VVFDPKDYRKRVLARYTRGGGSELSSALREMRKDSALVVPRRLDLTDFYDVRVGMPAEGIAAHIDAVVAAIKAAERGAGGSTHPRELHELIEARNAALRTESFWTAAHAARAKRAEDDLQRFAQEASAEFAGFAVVTMPRLRAVATGSGVPAAVDDAALASAVASVGVDVVPAFPIVSVPAQRLREIENGLKKTAARSVLSAVFLTADDVPTFTILDGFSAEGSSLSLTVSAVTASYDYSEHIGASNENDAYRKVLGAIRAAATTDAELLMLVIACFVETGRRVARAGGTQRGQLDAFVQETGIARMDAARILLEVQPQQGAAAHGWGDVQSLVANGAIKEARRAFGVISSELGGSASPEQEQALRSLVEAEARLDELRALASAAVAAGDIEAATKAYNDALTLCSDDDALTAAARAMPPAPPLRVVAGIGSDGRTVHLSWEPGFGSTEDVVYHVVRRVRSAPRNNLDGETIARQISVPAHTDAEPPIATPVWYGIAASRGGAASPVAVAEILVLPPVSEVAITTEPTSATVRWSTPPEALRIAIERIDPDGTIHDVPTGSQSAATLTGLSTGASYTFLLTAIYTGTDRAPLRSETVRANAIPRGVALPSTTLSVMSREPVADRPVVAVAWRAVSGFSIEVWHYDSDPGWRVGERLAMSLIQRQGTRLAGRPTPAAPDREGVEGVTLSGVRHYVAVTRDGDSGVIGAARAFGNAPMIRNVHFERFGTEVVLSWDWPGSEFDVQVDWNGATTGSRLLGPTEYRTEGGCRVSLGSAGGSITLASVASESAQGESWTSPPVHVTIPGIEHEVRYDVRFHRQVFGPPRGVTLTFGPDIPEALEVVVVASFSRFMPYDAAQGTIVGRAVVTTESLAVEAAIPRGKGPLWVRAFTPSDGVRLLDPPPARMKVE
jgi:hypothetical protein